MGKAKGDDQDMKAAQYWADYLKAYGVREVFGLPGTESLELVEASRRAGLDFWLTHHESTAAFMASMRGHLTGTPGVALATRGPGATNLTSGIGAAHLDRMPLLAVTGDHAVEPGAPTHQRLPLAELFAPITRASVQVSAESLPQDLPKLLAAATGDLPGPAFLAFPAPETSKEIAVAPPKTIDRSTSTRRSVPDLTPVIDYIRGSKRAMIIAGVGVSFERAGAELVQLAEALNCPVADTPQMKGWFPNDHPLYLGTYGTHRDQTIVELAQQSDLVLACGLDSVEFLKPCKGIGPVVSLSPTEVADPGLPAELVVSGPLREIFAALASEAEASESWPDGTAAELRASILDALIPKSETSPSGAMWPQAVVSELQHALPSDGIITVDVGSHKLLMVLQWQSTSPNTFLNSSGISAMGTGIPFGLAAKITYPSQPVVSVIGDGGYLMYTGELELLARSGLPVVVVVMNDQSLYSIKIKQLRRSFPPVGTEFSDVSIANIACDFGLFARRVTNRQECAAALREALQAERPAVIEAVIDPEGYDYSQ